MARQCRSECLRCETAGDFDLTAPPLLRVKLFRTGPQTHVLLLMSHHIVVDGASMQIGMPEMRNGRRLRPHGAAIAPRKAIPHGAADACATPDEPSHRRRWRVNADRNA